MVPVLSSALMPHVAVVAAMRLGAYDAITKPFNLEVVISALEDPLATPVKSDQPPTLDAVMREYVARIVDQCGGNLSQAARVLGIDRNTLKGSLRRP